MPNLNIKISQSLKVGGASAMKGHVGQEVKETIDTLLSGSPTGMVLVPATDNANGFRPLTLKDHHKGGGFIVSKERGSEVIAPSTELIAGVGGMKTRRAFIPEVYSEVLGRNLRFSVSLPPGFDPQKADSYPIVQVLPDTSTLAQHLSNGLSDKVDRELRSRDLDNAIVVVVERLDHKSWVEQAPLQQQARRALEKDVLPFVNAAFGGKSTAAATLTLPDLSDHQLIITAPTLRQEDRSAFVESQRDKPKSSGGGLFSSMMTFIFGGPSDDGDKLATPKDAPKSMDGYTFKSAGESEGPGKTKKKKKKSEEEEAPKVEKKASFAGSLVIAGRDRPKITSAGGWDGKVTSTAPLPEAKFFKPLGELDHAGVVVAAVASKMDDGAVGFGVVVPQGFSPDKRYPVDIVLAPNGKSAADVAKKIAADTLHVKDRLVLVVDGDTFKSPEQALHHAKNELLSALSDQLPVDLGKIHAPRTLGGDAATWAATVETAPTDVARPAGGPVVFADGKFRRLAPTNDHERTFPSLGWGRTDTSEIPKELQKQPADHGTMFVPVIDSKAVGKSVRCGVYLPPGYDPASNEKLPVLLMLPGKGSNVNVWTSAGDVTTQLDQMMQGAAQKMIVLIPDGTDSFWFDYDKNGTGSFGDKGKRDFEGHVMNEVLPYALEKLNGDKDKLAIAGISRGGFGAMQLAARHGDTFKSASAHSGVLALEHEGELSRMAGGEISKHFGESGDAAWKAFNPKDLVDSGKMSKEKRLLIDIGAQDGYFLDDNLRFADALDKKGLKYDLKIWGGEGGSEKSREKKHNWDTWAAVLPSWIAFHQTTFGKPGDVKLSGVKDVSASVRTERGKEMAEHEAELREKVKALVKALPKFGADELNDAAIYYGGEGQRHIAKPLVELAKSADDLKATLQTYVKTPHVHLIEARLSKLEGAVEELNARVRRARNSLVGEAVTSVKGKPGALDAFGGQVKTDIGKILEIIPEMKDALEKLATVRPSVFQGKDPITGVNFAAQLREFVKSKQYNPEKDRAGVVEFIDRMATRRYDWRRPGFSNAVTAVMNTIFQHPGIVLQLTVASRKGQTLDYPTFYKADSEKTVKPMGDLESAFSRVERTHSGGMGELPPAELGYERAVLRIVRDVLCPSAGSMPDTRAFGQRTNMPVAEGLAKLRGREMLYGYAFKLKTGDDLVKAVLSQGKEGLAMADTMISIRGGTPENVHFPVFYDFDPATRTIEMQYWSGGATRVSVDDLTFDEVGIYYEPHPDLDALLTPEKQANWNAIKASREPPAEKPAEPKGDGKGQSSNKKWSIEDD